MGLAQDRMYFNEKVVVIFAFDLRPNVSKLNRKSTIWLIGARHDSTEEKY